VGPATWLTAVEKRQFHAPADNRIRSASHPYSPGSQTRGPPAPIHLVPTENLVHLTREKLLNFSFFCHRPKDSKSFATPVWWRQKDVSKHIIMQQICKFNNATCCGVSLCVIQKPHEWGGPGSCWGVAPEKKNVVFALLKILVFSRDVRPHLNSKITRSARVPFGDHWRCPYISSSADILNKCLFDDHWRCPCISSSADILNKCLFDDHWRCPYISSSADILNKCLFEDHWRCPSISSSADILN
jgi:hypothetical protein